jgi:hypothetical protein
MISQPFKEQLWRRTRREGASLPVAFALGLAGYVIPRLVSDTPMPTLTWMDLALITASYIGASLLIEHRSLPRKSSARLAEEGVASSPPQRVTASDDVTLLVHDGAAMTCSVFVAVEGPSDAPFLKQLRSLVAEELQTSGAQVVTVPTASGMVVTSTFVAPNPVAHAVDAARRTQQTVFTSAFSHISAPKIWLASGSPDEYRSPQMVKLVSEKVSREALGGSEIFMVGRGIQQISVEGIRLGPSMSITVGVGKRPVEMAELRLVEKSA